MTAEITDPVLRALAIVGLPMPYELGTGDWKPKHAPDGTLIEDLPWTERAPGIVGSDCAGFAIDYCHRLTRHRPGFNHGPHATVSDDLNTDSAVEDACGARTLFTPIIVPWLALAADVVPGDLLVYKTIHIPGHGPWIGHVSIIVGVDQAFRPILPDWSKLEVAQCCGPNGRAPAVIKTDGSTWSRHDKTWGDHIDRRSVVIRPVPVADRRA